VNAYIALGISAIIINLINIIIPAIKIAKPGNKIAILYSLGLSIGVALIWPLIIWSILSGSPRLQVVESLKNIKAHYKG